MPVIWTLFPNSEIDPCLCPRALATPPCYGLTRCVLVTERGSPSSPCVSICSLHIHSQAHSPPHNSPTCQRHGSHLEGVENGKHVLEGHGLLVDSKHAKDPRGSQDGQQHGHSFCCQPEREMGMATLGGGRTRMGPEARALDARLLRGADIGPAGSESGLPTAGDLG